MWYKSKYLYGKKKRKKRKKLTSRLKILFVRIDLLPSNRYRSTTVVRIWIPRTEEPFRNKKKKHSKMSLDNDRSVVVERHPLDKESPFNSVFPRFVFFYGIPSHSCANRTLSLRIFHSSVSFLRAAKRRRRGQSAGILHGIVSSGRARCR